MGAMKRALPALLFVLLSFGVAAQDRVPVVFKVFPTDYELFVGGERLSYSPRGDVLRVYQLPAGPVRVSLSAAGWAPSSLSLQVKPGLGTVSAKLEPRVGPLSLLAEAPTGRAPRALAFSADGRRLFVALQGEPGVDLFEVPSLKKVGRLSPADPGQAAYTDVLVAGSSVLTVQTDGRVHAFDGATLTFQDSHDLSGGGNASLYPLGGGRLAIANWDNGQLISVDLAARRVLNTLSLGGSLRGFAVAGTSAWASLFDRGVVAALDASAWKVRGTWAGGKAPRPLAALGGRLFIGDMGSAQVLIQDAATGAAVGSVPVASNPHVMAVSADQTLVAVASRGKNNPDDYQKAGPEFGKVTLLSARGEVLASVWGRNQPTGLAFSANGRYLAFTDYLDDNVELYRLSR